MMDVLSEASWDFSSMGGYGGPAIVLSGYRGWLNADRIYREQHAY